MTIKYPSRDKQSATEIHHGANYELGRVIQALAELGAVAESLKDVLNCKFLPLQIKDLQRSGNARKFVSVRRGPSGNEFLTYSVQVTQGGTTGHADLVTIVGAIETDGPGSAIHDSDAPYMAKSDYADHGITGEPVRAMAGAIGRLQDLDALSIARALINARIQDETSGLGAMVADFNAHSFRAENWVHTPTNGRAWKNEGEETKRGKRYA